MYSLMLIGSFCGPIKLTTAQKHFGIHIFIHIYIHMYIYIYIYLSITSIPAVCVDSVCHESVLCAESTLFTYETAAFEH